MAFVAGSIGPAVVPVICAREQDDSLRTFLLGKYRAYAHAFAVKDYAYLPALLTGDYTFGPVGKTPAGRQQIFKTFSRMSQLSHGTSWAVEVREADRAGATARVLVAHHMRTQLTEPQQPPRKIVLDALFDDRWERIAGEWKLARTTVVRMKFTLDGKPLHFHPGDGPPRTISSMVGPDN